MGQRDVTPGDRIVPGRLWEDPRFGSLPAAESGVLLLLLACADLDGISPAPGLTEQQSENLEASGLVVLYGYAFDELFGEKWDPADRWAWLPEAPSWYPAGGSLRPARRDDWPAPSPIHVTSALSLRLGRPATEQECREACPRAFGKRRPASGVDSPGDDGVRLVFEAWRKEQAKPSGHSLTQGVRKVIRAGLKEAPADRLVSLVRFAFLADDARARYWRGENDQKAIYTSLDSLLRVDKIQGRLAMVDVWVAAGSPEAGTTDGGGDGRVQGTGGSVGQGAPHGILAQQRAGWGRRSGTA